MKEGMVQSFNIILKPKKLIEQKTLIKT